MANVFAILTAIALAAAAFLASKNKQLYADEIVARQNEEQRLADQTAKHGSLVTDFEETADARKSTEEETAASRRTKPLSQAKIRKPRPR